MIKFQQSQALPSHFEIFWSIVNGKDSLSKAQFNVPIYPDSHACGTFHNVYSRLSRKSLGFTNIFLIPTKG